MTIGRRAHYRAPLKNWLLYADGDYVFKAFVLDISEGGLLLEQLPHPPSERSLPVLLNIPQYPLFHDYEPEALEGLLVRGPARKIYRARIEIVREEKQVYGVDEVFKTRIGARFVQISPELKMNLFSYIAVYANNMAYMMKLAEDFGFDENAMKRFRPMGGILGYDSKEKISALRSKIEHDYLNLTEL
jgi:hypothetical protein